MLFQIPSVPFCAAISDEKTKLHSRDSYQPRESGDHSKRWIRGGEGSMVVGKDFGGALLGALERSVRMVCSGRDGSHESI